MSVNKVILIGNVGQDPEIRSTQDGRELANFSLATTENWKNKSTGERKDKTEWHKIVVFNQGLVGIVKNYVKKGSKLYIEGQLQTRKWNDNNGVEKYTTEVVLQNFNSSLQMLGSKSDDSQPAKSYGSLEDAVKGEFKGATTVNPVHEELEDDIPF